MFDPPIVPSTYLPTFKSFYLCTFLPSLAAVIAAVVLVLLCLAVVVLRYMYRHKGTYHTNEAKGTEFADTADAALRGDPALQGTVDQSRKEYFI